MFTFRRKKQRELYAPVNGCGIALDDVRDEVFSKRLMGDGCAFLPETTSVCSPIDGDLILVADTLHAFGVRSREGIELLIHRSGYREASGKRISGITVCRYKHKGRYTGDII